jgi:beta-lactamase class A
VLAAQVAVFGVMVGVSLTTATIALQLAKARPSDPVFEVVPGPALAAQASVPGSGTGAGDAALTAQLSQLVAGSGARVGLAVVDLGGVPVNRVALNATDRFDAASTYKLPVLMANAEAIARGVFRNSDRICAKDGELEDGWFDDYDVGDCFSRQTLAMRAGRYSDNTAGHMLVDNLGGVAKLNAYAQSRGATDSDFFYPNDTTAADLARLLVDESLGGAGGRSAQTWLYPLLTDTAFEQGIPAGVPDSVTVVHKIGAIDSTVNDVGIVNGPKRSYVIAVTTDGLGGDAGWALIAKISAQVWAAESA